MSDLFRYAAFISYSSKDAAFSKRLHRALESYGIPDQLGNFDLIGGGKRNRIYPVFRDREELSAGDLGERIEASLRASAALIVICTPNAAASPWVQKEIEFFAANGRRDKIFAIIADNAPLLDDTGADATALSFPPALRGDALADPNALEPLAADARKGKDGFRNAWLKIVAGLIGVTPGQIIDRDRKRGQQQRYRVAAGVSILALAVAAATGMATTQTWRTRLSTYAEATAGKGQDLDAAPFALAGIPSRGALMTAQGDRAESVAVSVASRQLPLDLGKIQRWDFSSDGEKLLTGDNDDNVTVYNLTSGTRSEVGRAKGITASWFSADGKKLFIQAAQLLGNDPNESDLTFYNLENGSRATPLGVVRKVVRSDDSQSFVTVSSDGKVSFYNLSNGRIMALGDLGEVQDFFLGAGAKTLAVWAKNNGLALYDVAGSGKSVALGVSKEVKLVARGRALLQVAADGRMTLYDLVGHSPPVKLGDPGSVEYAGGDSLLFSRDHDGTYQLYDLARHGKKLALRNVFKALASANGDALVTRGDDDRVTYYDLSRDAIAIDLGDIGQNQWALSKDGRILAMQDTRGIGAFYNLSKGAAKTGIGNVDTNITFDLSANGRTLYSNRNNHRSVYDLFKGGEKTDLADIGPGKYELSSDGGSLVIRTFEGSHGWLYDLSARGAATDLGQLYDFEFSPNGSSIVARNEGNTGELYDLQQGLWIKQAKGGALWTAICKTSGDKLRPFPNAQRSAAKEFTSFRQTRDTDQRIYEGLKGRPWNACDWRGLATIWKNERTGDDWFEGPRQWLRLRLSRWGMAPDYECGEGTFGASQRALDNRRVSCRLNNAEHSH